MYHQWSYGSLGCSSTRSLKNICSWYKKSIWRIIHIYLVNLFQHLTASVLKIQNKIVLERQFQWITHKCIITSNEFYFAIFPVNMPHTIIWLLKTYRGSIAKNMVYFGCHMFWQSDFTWLTCRAPKLSASSLRCGHQPPLPVRAPMHNNVCPARNTISGKLNA